MAEAMSPAEWANPKYFPRWLHALRATETIASVSEDWAGRLRAVKKELKLEIGELKTQSKVQSDRVETTVNAVNAEVKAMIEGKVAEMEAKVEAKLDQVLAVLATPKASKGKSSPASSQRQDSGSRKSVQL